MDGLLKKRLLCLAMAMLLAGGCGARQKPEGAAPQAGTQTAVVTSLPEPKDEKVETPLKYALAASFETKLDSATGIAIGADDRVYVAWAEGVKVFDADMKPLWGVKTAGAARAVAVDASGNIYAAERVLVETFDSSGKPLASWGREGKGRGEFSVLSAIAVSGANVFAADPGNRCVHRFDLTGDFIDELGKRDKDSKDPGLICPSAILDCKVDAQGNVRIVNPGRQRIERYRLTGELMDFWGEPGVAPENFIGCCNPAHIAFGPDGRIVTGVKGIPRVKVYSGDGKLLAYIGPSLFSDTTSAPDVAVDSKGRIYALDTGDGRVKIFAEEK